VRNVSTTARENGEWYDHGVVLHHLAAVLFFAGPLFYFGVWLALDPVVIAEPIGLLVRAFRPAAIDVPQRLRTGVRFAGVLLVLIAIAI